MAELHITSRPVYHGVRRRSFVGNSRDPCACACPTSNSNSRHCRARKMIRAGTAPHPRHNECVRARDGKNHPRHHSLFATAVCISFIHFFPSHFASRPSARQYFIYIYSVLTVVYAHSARREKIKLAHAHTHI